MALSRQPLVNHSLLSQPPMIQPPQSQPSSNSPAVSEKDTSEEEVTASDHSVANPTRWPRQIKSFVMRAGRTTGGQQKAIDLLGPKYLIPFTSGRLDLAATFNDSQAMVNQAPNEPDATMPRKKILEIGFGMGETTAHIAQIRPQDDFLAIEVHEPGVGALLKLIGENQIENIRIIRHDAVEVVETMLLDNSLDGFHLFFPDPWHKKKHNKRRLVQSEFLEKILPKLKSGAYIHMATDWQAYADQMLEVLSKHSQISNTATLAPDALGIPNGFAMRPAYRPVTKFENRGLKLGHGVWDLVFLKN